MVSIFLRQASLCLTSMFSVAAFTVISPFYPAVADRQGVPQYLFGIIFSSFPIGSLFISFFLPSIMQRIGRTSALLLGLLLISTSNILISNLETLSSPYAIALSFISRLLSGFGGAFSSISCATILTSDYPNNIAKLIAISEICIGCGLIIGPTVGSVLYAYGGFSVSCRVIGLAMLCWIPVLFLLVGRSRPYEITNIERIDIKEIVSKPKILVHAFMPFSLMFSVGIWLPTLEMHILSYGIQEANVGYWYNSYTLGYLVCSTMLMFPYKTYKPKIMAFGLVLLSIGYMLLGPSPVLFTRSKLMMVAGLNVIGCSTSLVFGKLYLVPSIPFMIELAHSEYHYAKDDRLNDSISGLVNIFYCIAEILGPVLGSLSVYICSYPTFYSMVAAMYFSYALFYILFSGVFSGKKPHVINETLLVDF